MYSYIIKIQPQIHGGTVTVHGLDADYNLAQLKKHLTIGGGAGTTSHF
jgi:hypothetical protein